MCGIFGFTKAPDRELLLKMGESLRHRGPDAQGFWQDENCSLGLDRLAIVDIAGGMQPCVSNGIVSVMNGEIYNFIELRSELEAFGHKFSSDHSDAELLPAAYLQWGEEFVSHLDGMFAVAIWDARSRRLLLARDHVGKKPLYYGFVGKRLIFGSEIKAVRCAGLGGTICKEALACFLQKKNTTAPLTIYEDIKQLLPATLAVWDGEKLQQKNYWKPNFNGEWEGSEVEYAAMILRELERAVEIRCRTDVEFGAFLSGGLDSSLIATLAARRTKKQLQTFTLCYDEPIAGKDEDERFAQMVADKIGAKRHILRIGHEDVWSALPSVLGAFDEPFSATISPYFLCSLVAKYVKVALAGDGADEIFGSYKTHRDAALLGGEALNKTLEEEFCDQLPNQVLTYADRLSMAHSVEVRSPFLDRRLVEMVGRIPSRYKIKNGEVKYILKVAAKELLPQQLIWRKKEGFVLPVWRWMESVWSERVNEVLNESDMYERFGIDKSDVLMLLAEFKNGAPHHAKIWGFVNLAVWSRGNR